MSKTILQMVTAAEAELGLPQSTSVYGTSGGVTDSTGTQMGALANRVLDELRRMNRWTAMQFEYNLAVEVPLATAGDTTASSAVITAIPSTSAMTAFNYLLQGTGIPTASRIQSVDSSTQVTMTMENTVTGSGISLSLIRDTYPMPSGFDWMNNRTMWDRTNHWELLGPDSPQISQWEQSGIVATGPRRHFRKIGPYASTFRIWPPPTEITVPIQLVFEYLSTNAVAVAGSATSFAQYFTADTDTCLLDDNAVIMGIKWMFWEVKGFGSYVTMQSRWVDYVDRLIARDGAAPTLQVAKRKNPIFISPANIQDGNFPSS